MHNFYNFSTRHKLFNTTVSARLCPLFLLLCFTACSSSQSSAQNQLENISVTIAGGLSEQFLTEIDLLFVYDGDLLNQLPFTQFDWISSREQYLDYSDGQIDLLQLTITAEFQELQLTLPNRSRSAVGILVFASHADPVADVIDITQDIDVELQIDPYGINVVSH